jgi:hypothetical protein
MSSIDGRKVALIKGGHGAWRQPSLRAAAQELGFHQDRSTDNRVYRGASKRPQVLFRLAPLLLVFSSLFLTRSSFPIAGANIPYYILAAFPIALLSFPRVASVAVPAVAAAFALCTIGALQGLFHPDTITTRMMATVSLVVVLSGAYWAIAAPGGARALVPAPAGTIRATASAFLVANLAAQIGQLIGVVPQARYYINYLLHGLPRATGLVEEPAQLSVILATILVTELLLFGVSRGILIRIALVLASLVLAPSFTAIVMMAIVGIVLTIRLPKGRARVFAHAITIVVGAFAINALFLVPEIAQRSATLAAVFGGGNIYDTYSSNASVAVIVDGLVRTLRSLSEYPLGVGMNNFGVVGPSSTNVLYSKNWNLLDGSSLGLKMIAEFGVFSVLIYHRAIRAVFRSLVYKTISMTLHEYVVTLAAVNFFLSHIRGAGYFDGPALFLLLITFGDWAALQFHTSTHARPRGFNAKG